VTSSISTLQLAVSADALKTGAAIEKSQQYRNRVISKLSVTANVTGNKRQRSAIGVPVR